MVISLQHGPHVRISAVLTAFRIALPFEHGPLFLIPQVSRVSQAPQVAQVPQDPQLSLVVPQVPQ
eukprot:781482-Pyramimonas_sp.AAC.1